jgi:hypothetical protein
MILTFYEYINESRGISDFIKKLSTTITGGVYKKYEELSNSSDSGFTLVFDLNYEEIKMIKKIIVIIKNNNRNYNSKFVSKNELNKEFDDIFLEFDLPLKKDLDPFYLHELVIHEMTHLYEYYNIVKNKKAFPLYDKIKKSLIRTLKQDEFDVFSYFRNLVYLTLDNELNARVAQTYQLLKFQNIKSKDLLLNNLKTTHIWKKYKEIDNFNPKKYTSDLLEFIGLDLTKILINQFNLELKNNDIDFKFIKNVENELDILLYFNNWNKRFKYKLKKHLNKLNRVVDEVIEK